MVVAVAAVANSIERPRAPAALLHASGVAFETVKILGVAVPTMLMLSGVFMAMTFIVFAVYGVFAAGARKHLIARPHIINRIRRLFAISFVALGAKLATESR